MKQYDLIFITSYPFPKGLASTNRIMSYAKEIARTKKVLVISYCSSPYMASNSKYTIGEISGVDYRYIRPSDPIKKNIFQKIIYRLITVYNLYKALLFDYRTKCVICYNYDISFFLRIFFISKLRNFRVMNDITETFENHYNSDLERNRQKKIRRHFDGLIVMTEGIKGYFQGINPNIFILPMSVDISRFDALTVEKGNDNYFFYCSGGVLERDGLLDSLRGFILFNSKYPDYKFKIATPLNLEDPYHKNVKEIIDSYPSIEYLGLISSDDIPKYMVNSIGLLVTPHHDYITKGFPTKLGEYFASSKPVICTSIPSLTESLDEGCSYMVHPNSPEEISEAMVDIVANPDNAFNIGRNGKNFVCQHYTVGTYLQDLLSFLNI